ncbi:hypothetical protein EVAR_82515_1 [Eumeta japonica]|uniref:Uncharacterized protein n=1 Tax=Eumeta variegata TaxID=151549 RepID=A0A4C1UWA7_EUMVA|nr:hypothetical protein EVAR_82515_1 [Eumeta japonica]
MVPVVARETASIGVNANSNYSTTHKTAAVKLVTKASQWRKIASGGEKGRLTSKIGIGMSIGIESATENGADGERAESAACSASIKLESVHCMSTKLCTQRIFHNLTEAQKLRRVDWCREMIKDLPVVTQMLRAKWLHATKAVFTVTSPKPKDSLFKKLRGKWFTDAEEAVTAYEKAVEATSKFE